MEIFQLWVKVKSLLKKKKKKCSDSRTCASEKHWCFILSYFGRLVLLSEPLSVVISIAALLAPIPPRTNTHAYSLLPIIFLAIQRYVPIGWVHERLEIDP